MHFSIIKWCNYYRLLLCATLHALPLISSSLLHFSLPDSLFMCNLTIAFFMQTNFLIFLVHLIFFRSTIIQNFQPRTSLSSAHNFYTILKFITSECWLCNKARLALKRADEWMIMKNVSLHMIALRQGILVSSLPLLLLHPSRLILSLRFP